MRSLDDPDLNAALDAFLRAVGECLGHELVSVTLYGSVVFDDLAPGYGDLDFLAVVQNDLPEDMCRRLIELRWPFRAGQHGVIGKMLEGAFLPRRMLEPAVKGRALWWGTTGERPWEENRLGWLVLHVIRERGVVIWGEDVRLDIPIATRDDLLSDIRRACVSIREHGRGGELHSVDWLLTAARLLLWLREGRLTSKSEAAEWGATHARGTWREFLPRAKEMPLNPSLAEHPEIREWLQSLAEPIRRAGAELENELALRRSSI